MFIEIGMPSYKEALRMSKRVVFVDLDHVLADYSTGVQEYKTRYPELEFPQSEPGMYMSLKPLDGAIIAYKWLDDNFDTLNRP